MASAPAVSRLSSDAAMPVHQPSANPSVWAACAQPDGDALQNILQGLGWDFRGSRSIHQTLVAMRDNRVDIVICNEQLSDGCWKDLLAGFGQLQCPPPLVVIAERFDSNLWAEVLNLGGFDVLLRPLTEKEIAGVLHMAHRHHNKRKQAASLAAKSLRATSNPAA